MFERFTERARQVVVLAQDEARALKHNYIGTEHILLGLLREEEGLAARTLESLKVDIETVRERVAAVIGEGDAVTTGQIPFTPRSKKVLELALKEARALRHNYIGTEHILLALARENEGVASRVLDDFGAPADRVRRALLEQLSGGAPPEDTGEPRERKWWVTYGATQTVPARYVSVTVMALLAAATLALGLLLGWLIWA